MAVISDTTFSEILNNQSRIDQRTFLVISRLNNR